jgi:hypothetical protein
MVVARYRKDIILPAGNLVYDFVATLACCRATNDNLVNNGDALTLTAHLDRSLGENSLPKPKDSDFIIRLCSNSPYNFVFGGYIADKEPNDTSEFLAATPQAGTYTSLSTMGFKNNRTQLEPLPVDITKGGYHVNPSNGRVTVAPSAAGE